MYNRRFKPAVRRLLPHEIRMANEGLHLKMAPNKKTRSQAPGQRSELGPSRKERMAAGKILREKTPRTSHAKWKPPDSRRDPVAQLKSADKGRVRELLPIRYGRMSQSPFAFLRGAAALMAPPQHVQGRAKRRCRRTKGRTGGISISSYSPINCKRFDAPTSRNARG